MKPWTSLGMPMLEGLHRCGKVISHFCAPEMLYARPEPYQEYRCNDALSSLWNILKLTSAGRGDFHPQLSYLSINSKDTCYAQHA